VTRMRLPRVDNGGLAFTLTTFIRAQRRRTAPLLFLSRTHLKGQILNLHPLAELSLSLRHKY
jgi:hypothetical protein